MFKIMCFKGRKKNRFIFYFFKKHFNRFIYSKRMHRWKRKRLFNKDYIVTLRKLLLFRTFYGDFTIKKLKSFFKKTNKRRLDYISKCLFLFESRMDILLYRLNFFKSPRESRNFIRNKNMKINKKNK